MQQFLTSVCLLSVDLTILKVARWNLAATYSCCVRLVVILLLFILPPLVPFSLCTSHDLLTDPLPYFLLSFSVQQIIYPQNGSNEPIYNKYGKFIVKLHVNGVPRRVVIDDRLPFDPVNKKLLCSCSKNPTEFWISLVEKAYLKLNGGYDFPGSNSGIDVHCLTGWM